ncbi:hypothetical protein GCM10010082_31770 [Kushneria pakistanensis]|uniref:Tail fiber assembly protein n=2 Tax=Kushneria pakistanensis TaxID=1508770 RepID=A0ABQ3FRW5_9GAMM|nr:hypothetical protein GCM10010082_31770 [Kushneria pakistanensis]
MLFSASEGVFYDPAHEASYREAGNWPSDLIAVTAEVFEQYGRAGAAVGKRLSSGRDGQPCWIDIEPESPETRRDGAINWIDATADRIRAADRSVGQYLDAEYQIVAEALVAYRNDPDGEVPEAVQSYADAEGLTVKAAAEQIAEAAARAVELLQTVRRVRLAGKAAVRDATDDADMLEVAQPYINELEALAKPAEPAEL